MSTGIGGALVHRSFDEAMLRSLREMSSANALASIAIIVKPDATFVPSKDPRTQRWQVCSERGDFEILTTGSKWYDTRAQTGGGGAIDLAMQVLNLSFVDAVRRLSIAAAMRFARTAASK
jgi:hypothetical protein